MKLNRLIPTTGKTVSARVYRVILFTSSFFFMFLQNRAANRFWVAAAAGNWSNTANWSVASGGAGGASVPGAADAVTFNGNGLGNCNIDIVVGITSINVNATYTGTISQNANTITVSTTATFAGGIFTGGSADITLTGVFTNSGTAFTSTSGVLELRSNAAFTGGSFTHNNGTVRFNGLSVGGPNISGTSPSFYILELVGLGKTYTFSSAGDITVNHALNISGLLSCVINTGVFDVLGDINITNSAIGGGGNALINIDGTGTQNYNGASAANEGALPQLTINTTGTVNLTGFPSVDDNFTYTAGTINAGVSTFCFVRTTVGAYTITGSLSLNNVVFDAETALTPTFAAGTVLTVPGTLTISGTAAISLNTGVAGATAIQAQGNILVSNTGAGGGTAGILINGAGGQNFTSTVPAGEGRMPYITIQKASGTLVLIGIISERRDWTYISGAVDAFTNLSTVAFGGGGLTVTSNGMSFYNVSVIANTTTLGNNLSVLGDLDIPGGVLAAGANTINLNGNWNNSGGSFTEGTSTVNFIGSAVQTISNPAGENFYNLTVNNSGSGIQLINAVDVRNILNMNQGNIDLNGQALTLGISAANKGTLVRTNGTMINAGSFTRWFNSSTIADGSITGLFPVGTATDYRPFNVSAPVTKPTTGGTITVGYTDATTNSIVSIPDGAFTVVLRKDLNWAVSTGNGLAGGTYDMEAQGTGFGQIGNVSDLRLTLANSVVGNPGVNAGTVTDPQINRTGLSFANLTNSFYVGSINAVSTTLPVILVSFTATPENGTVKLDWETSEEINNDHFTIERSVDAVNWQDLQSIAGSGNSNTDSYYTAYDAHPLSGISFYRLKQTDMDGRDTYSFIRSVTMEKTAAINVYPNPATNYIVVDQLNGEKTTVALFNSNGQRMQATVIYNGTSATLYVSGTASGIYYIQIRQGNSVETRKVAIGK